MKTTLLKLGEVRKTVVADPELDGCDLRDSRAWRRIAGGVCLLGNDRAASVRLSVLRITRFKMDFCELSGGRGPSAPNHIAVHGDNMVSC